MTLRSRLLNRMVWELQYRIGYWRRLDTSDGSGHEILRMVGEQFDEPTILDLGCGTTANLPLDQYPYRHYHGVDLSHRAIGEARALQRPRTSFSAEDALAFTTCERYDAILLREVLYYLRVSDIPILLQRLGGALTPCGRIFIQLHIAGHVTEAIRSGGLNVVEERPRSDGSDAGILIVLAPAS